MTYRVTVRRKFIAQHYLVGSDWGPENELHSHPYTVEVELEGPGLDRHGYLVDIVDIEAGLDEVRNYYSDRTLNDLPEFDGLNPSIEHFARVVCLRMQPRLAGSEISALTVKIWEHEDAWASYRLDL